MVGCTLTFEENDMSINSDLQMKTLAMRHKVQDAKRRLYVRKQGLISTMPLVDIEDLWFDGIEDTEDFDLDDLPWADGCGPR
jgi:hypothetical protein